MMEVLLKPGDLRHDIGTIRLYAATSKPWLLYDVFENEEQVVEIWIPVLEKSEVK